MTMEPQQPRRPITFNIETIRLQASSLTARIQSRVSMETLRSLPLFLGLSPNNCLGPTAFTPPVKTLDKSTLEKIQSRVSLNVAYFLTNYLLVASMTGLVIALLHPGMVFFLVLCYSLWMVHGFLIRNEFILFGIPVHGLLTVQQRFYGLFVVTTLVVVWKCLVPTLLWVWMSAFLILTHAFLRDPKDVEAFDSNPYLQDDDLDLEGGNESSGSSEVLVERPNSSGKRSDKK